MNQKKRSIKQIMNILPVVGIITFVGLYIFSSMLYPGGSQVDLNSEGFDWVNNYWCNLMNEKGMNGQPNPARPYSILAMIVLCFSLIIFFNQFAESYTKSKIWKLTIKTTGIISMIFASLIFTEYHDLMTTLSSIFGLFVVIGVIREIYKSELTIYKITGIVCIFLLGINNYIYYTQELITFLPILQKITVLIVLIWILGLNHEMNKMNKKNKKLAKQCI